MPKGMLVNKQHFCDFLGITKYLFDKKVGEGMPIHQRPATKQDEYLVFAGDAIAWMLDAAAANAGGKRAGETKSFEEERIRLTAEQADQVALKNAVARAELLPAGEVLTGWQAAVGRARGLLLGISTAAAARVVQVAHAHQDDPDAAERAIREYLRDQLDAAMAELQNTSVDEPDEDEGDDVPEETGETAVIAASAKPERRRAH